MSEHSNRVPPALKHGIYSGIGLLPTESPARFRKFKKQRLAELNLVGRLEQDVGEQIVCLEWRQQNLFTYDLAKQARSELNAIYSKWMLRLEWDDYELELLPKPGSPTPEQVEASRKRAHKRARRELGGAFELTQIGEVATLDYLQKRVEILGRLDGMITRAYKKLLYLRGIKSMAASAPPAPDQLLLPKAA